MKEDQSHNSKSPPFSPAQSPPTSPANPPKQLLKQHTAPAMVIASGAATGNSCSFGAGPPAAASHNPNHLQTAQQQTYGMSSSLDSAEASKLLADGVSGGGAGGHVNPLVISDGSKAAGPHVSGSSTGVHVQHGQENGNWTMFEDDENHGEQKLNLNLTLLLNPLTATQFSPSHAMEIFVRLWICRSCKNLLQI